ncbi:MAG: tRNA 4-thiouridine(8) synthase ThiI [Lachnospiraceae bacterium]|nr:tRNA 4-thiouridine(8) synthase ThiI [Lachnospiraceae bacterium]
MFQAFLIKYGEIGIKGKNRYLFEDALVHQIKLALQPVEGNFVISTERGRVYVEAKGAFDYDDAVLALSRVFGIIAICPMWQVELTDYPHIEQAVIDYMDEVYPDKNKSFKVFTKRADKEFPMNSQEINVALGDAILDAYPEMHVDVHNPEISLNVELRTKLNIYSESIPGPGGMPVGTAGKAMLLLSGGIDSPVAGYMIAKRGVVIEAVYFHAPPYTSERAKQKVIDLAKIVARYSGPIRLHIVNFTDIQLYIYDCCPHDELTIIMRRYMMRIAEHFAKQDACLGLITGESIGQVASQTMKSLAATNEVCTMPVYRPLIAFDKNDIVSIAERIDTFETSILPYEDCCTIFVAKHPVTKPNVGAIKRSEKKLDEKIDEMVETAVSTAEILEIEADRLV